MNVSKELQEQLDNLDTKGYFRLKHMQKIELELHLGYKINKSCADCIKSEMFKLIRKNKIKIPTIHFIGVKQ